MISVVLPSAFTLYVTSATVPLALTITFAVVPAPFTKFTVSYAFTKSFAPPFSCKFQPAFNTSPTVAALFTLTLSASVPKTGAVPDVVGACVPVFAPAKLPATFVTAKLPASIPLSVTLGVFGNLFLAASTNVKPVLSNLVPPTVKLPLSVRLTSSAKP